MVKQVGWDETVLNGSYGDVGVSQVKQIEVWYDSITKEMGFVINGKNEGKAATINAEVLYGYILVEAKGNMRVSMVPAEGECYPLMFECRNIKSLYSLVS